MLAVISYLHAHVALILGVAFGISESLAQIPAVKANSIFELVYGLLAKLLGK